MVTLEKVNLMMTLVYPRRVVLCGEHDCTGEQPEMKFVECKWYKLAAKAVFCGEITFYEPRYVLFLFAAAPFCTTFWRIPSHSTFTRHSTETDRKWILSAENSLYLFKWAAEMLDSVTASDKDNCCEFDRISFCILILKSQNY